MKTEANLCDRDVKMCKYKIRLLFYWNKMEWSKQKLCTENDTFSF